MCVYVFVEVGEEREVVYVGLCAWCGYCNVR